MRLSPNKDISADYIFQLLSTGKKKIWAKTHANKAVSQASIKKSTLDNQEVLLPTLPEQSLIGSFFSNLDRLITLQSQKLSALDLYKKALLQRMFV